MENIPESAGLSSFNLLDEHFFFKELDVKPGITMLDLACGLGNYAVAAASYVGPDGIIYALDIWEEGIETLEVRTAITNINNIRPVVTDVCKKIPVGDQSVDLCLMATIIHILVDENKAENMLNEVCRVLKPGGRAAVVEFKKIEGPPGPPLSLRHSPRDLEKILSPYHLQVQKTVEVGPFNYLSIFGASFKTPS